MCVWAHWLWLAAWRWQQKSLRGPGRSWRWRCTFEAADPPGRTDCPAAPPRTLREDHNFNSNTQLSFYLSLWKLFSHTDSQLINQIVAMVTEKKRSSSMGTLTSAAVRIKSSRIKTRLPAIRIASDILKTHKKTHTHTSVYYCKLTHSQKSSLFKLVPNAWPLVEDGVEQGEEQQGQLWQQCHPVVEVVFFLHRCAVDPFCFV